jgi:hypothetical protein
MKMQSDYVAKKAPRRRRRPVVSSSPAPAGLVLVGIPDIGIVAGDLEMYLDFDTTEEHPLSSVAGADPAK